MNNLLKSIICLFALHASSFVMASQLNPIKPEHKTQPTPPLLIMGYKEGSKPPYIGSKNNNQGAYQELFAKAAEMIGHQLKIVRFPKKRIYQQLSQGKIDFYPASGFTSEREKYLYWLPTGFVSKPALLSNIVGKEITDFRQAKGILLSPLGSSVAKYAKYNYRISVQKMGVLPIDKAVLALKLGRGNFYIYDLDTLDYYLKRQDLKSFEDISLRLHPNAIQKEFTYLYAAFSIHSKHFKSINNPHYQSDQKSSFNNQKLTPSKDSIAYAFEEALKTLQSSDITSQIYTKYFK